MKLPKLIIKNFKILIRSKSSALIVIFGPLLLILLVGLAFSNSSTFTLNIGIYTPEKNNLTESFIANLGSESYKLTTFSSEQECFENIKSSGVHTCIIFPEDFRITNNKTNVIKFYIDQTKQNFVYAVINTLTASFGKRSTELSLDMTTDIVDVLSRSQNTVSQTKKDELANAKDLTEEVLSTSKGLQNKLEDNQVDTGSVKEVSGGLEKEGKVLRNRIADIYNQGADLLNLSYTIVLDSDTEFHDVNKSEEYWEGRLEVYDNSDGKLFQAWNESNTAREAFVNKTYSLTSSVTSLIDSVEDATESQKEVIAGLKNGLDEDVHDMQDELDDIEKNLGKVISDINTITVSSAENIVSPIVTTVETVVPEKTHLDYLFPSLIVLLIMFISILLSSTLVLMEKNSKAHFRNFITPTNDFVFVLSTFLTSIILMIVQIMVVLLIAGVIFNTPFFHNILNIFLLIFLISSVFVLLGMAIGYLFNTEQTAMMGSISIGSIILLTSDLILPIENMPPAVQSIAQFNPFVVGAEALKKTILFSSTLQQIEQELYFFGISILIISAIILLIQQIMKMHYVNRYSRAKEAGESDTPKNIKDIFVIDNHLIANEKELYRFIKRLPRKDFKKLIYKKSNKIADFTDELLKDRELAKLLSKMRTRWGMLKVIEKYTSQRFKEVQHKPSGISLPKPDSKGASNQKAVEKPRTDHEKSQKQEEQKTSAKK